ncbi:MAG: phospholipid carrier-dependent glycosyltransferase, partial [Arenimonas sp.]
MPAAPPGGAPARSSMLLLVLLLALSAWIQLTVAARTEVDGPLRADAADYFSYAWNLDRLHVYSSVPTWRDPTLEPIPDALRTPGYPLFLLLAGHPQPDAGWLHRVVLLQALLGIGSVLLAWLVARAFLARGPALLAALVVAIHPWLATSGTYLLSESLFTFLLLATVLLALRAYSPGAQPWRALLAGVACGVCSLVRPTTEFLPLLFLAAAWLWPSLRGLRRPALLAFLAFALVWSPWALRNRIVDVGDSASHLMVGSLAHGSYPGFMYDEHPESFGFPYRFDPEYPVFSRDLPSVLAHLRAEFTAHPARYARWYLLGKPWYFLSLEDVQSMDVLVYPVSHTPYFEDLRFALMRLLSRALHWPLVMLGLLAMALLALRPAALRLAPGQQRAAMLAGVVVGYAIALHMVAAPFPRYGIPFRPLLYALAL